MKYLFKLGNSVIPTGLKSFFVKLFCRHDWRYFSYNIQTHEWAGDGKLITIGFQMCPKCAHSKLNFIFGNE